ncbi:MAG: SpoIID/LytB domain-containing protein [bacterium]|nr:MAG: SpoIID/LytB domain-containing protein [bacterium]
MRRSGTTCVVTAMALTLALILSSCGGPEVVRRPEVTKPAVPVVTPGVPLDRPPVVRVLILDARNNVRVKATTSFHIGGELEVSEGTRLEESGDFTVRCAQELVRFQRGGEAILDAPVVSIVPHGRGHIYINGRAYRGGFIFRPVHGKVITINVLEIDDYLKGVLPAEIGYLKSDQFEAYRVQAIASRSYALSKLEEKKGEMYDLQATIMDQVYKGVNGEDPEASRAVDETRGRVALWRGEPVRAYYSACCGGHTADIRICWPWKDSYPYLHGGRDASERGGSNSFCSRSPHFRWRVHWSGNTLERMLKKTLPGELKIRRDAVGSLTDLKQLGTSPDGRITSIKIVTTHGTYRIDGDRIRWVLKPDPNSNAILKSTLFKMSVKRARGKVVSVNLVGGGNGHGVGMCQAGAVRMAEFGYSAEEILGHYYPGIVIVRFY